MTKEQAFKQDVATRLHSQLIAEREFKKSLEIAEAGLFDYERPIKYYKPVIISRRKAPWFAYLLP